MILQNRAFKERYTNGAVPISDKIVSIKFNGVDKPLLIAKNSKPSRNPKILGTESLKTKVKTKALKNFYYLSEIYSPKAHRSNKSLKQFKVNAAIPTILIRGENGRNQHSKDNLPVIDTQLTSRNQQKYLIRNASLTISPSIAEEGVKKQKESTKIQGKIPFLEYIKAAAPKNMDSKVMKLSCTLQSKNPLYIVDQQERKEMLHVPNLNNLKDKHHDRKQQSVTTIEASSDLAMTSRENFSVKFLEPEVAIRIYGSELAKYETVEILKYKEIYYVGQIRAKLLFTDEALPNYGWDDRKGFYEINMHDHLHYRYEIVSCLGKGSFGLVFKCFDHKFKKIVAIKILRNKPKYHKQGRIEIEILKKLQDPAKIGSRFVVELMDHFVFRNHICIVQEMLDMDLYKLIKATSYLGFKLQLVKAFAKQLIIVLSYMKSMNIIHCDLKPENILLRDSKKSAIKVIDFGTGCFENHKVYTYIQSRFYRAPEIMLGISYSTAIDMWSFGCILVELFLGYPLFCGEDEPEQMAMIMEYLGVPAHRKGTRSNIFFDFEFKPIKSTNSQGVKLVPGSKCLSEPLQCNDKDFLDFITKCLEWDPEKRLTPQEASTHAWITKA